MSEVRTNYAPVLERVQTSQSSAVCCYQSWKVKLLHRSILYILLSACVRSTKYFLPNLVHTSDNDMYSVYTYSYEVRGRCQEVHRFGRMLMLGQFIFVLWRFLCMILLYVCLIYMYNTAISFKHTQSNNTGCCWNLYYSSSSSSCPVNSVCCVLVYPYSHPYSYESIIDCTHCCMAVFFGRGR